MNKIKAIKKWLLILLFFSIFICCSTVEEQKHKPTIFLWKLETEKTTMYFLGSTHLANKEFYPLDERIEKAYAESDILVVEANVLSIEIESFQIQVMEKMIYAGDDSLENHISKDILGMLISVLEKHSVPFEYISKFKPWAVEQFVILLEYQAMGINPDWGIDVHFLKSAIEQEKQILELEGVEEQLDFLESFSEELQELSLKTTLIEIAALENYVELIFDMWKNGKGEALYDFIYKTYEDFPELAPLYDTLYIKRNNNMAQKLLDMIARGGKYFVVVGAAHFVGPDSIIAILSKENYKIEQF